MRSRDELLVNLDEDVQMPPGNDLYLTLLLTPPCNYIKKVCILSRKIYQEYSPNLITIHHEEVGTMVGDDPS